MTVSELAGPTKANVQDVERVGSISVDDVPRTLEEALSEVGPAVDNMEDEGMDYVKRVSAVQELSTDFLETAPKGMQLGDGTQCSGIGVRANDGSVVYRQQTNTGARTPEQHRNRSGEYPSVFKSTSSNTVTVGTVENVGRMRGPFGYSDDGNLIVGALASFTHNWVAKLIGYFERADLPFDGGWALPNLVLAETEEPAQFHPDASFAFNTRPALNTTFSVVLASPTPAKVGFDIWNSDKESVARVDSVDIPEGETRTFVRASNVPPSNGYFNIVPRDAPNGITVKSVSTQPMSF